MKRQLLILCLLAGCMTICASPESEDAAKEALAKADELIAYEQRTGNVEKEDQARWQKIVTLKNFSKTQEQLEEAEIQM